MIELEPVSVLPVLRGTVTDEHDERIEHSIDTSPGYDLVPVLRVGLKRLSDHERRKSRQEEDDRVC